MALANIKYAISAALFANIIRQNTPATTDHHGSLTFVWGNNQKGILNSYSSNLIWQVSCKRFLFINAQMADNDTLLEMVQYL